MELLDHYYVHNFYNISKILLPTSEQQIYKLIFQWNTGNVTSMHNIIGDQNEMVLIYFSFQ